MKWSLFALCIGFCIDLLIGDPHGLPHPVAAIGHLISLLERLFRRLFPKTPGGERAAGACIWILTALIAAALPALLLWGCARVSVWLRLAVESVMCGQILAAKSLRDESMKVYAALKHGSLDEARQAVSMIVGRDVARLDARGVMRAAVETVAENTSDGVIAPMFYMALAGPAGAYFYKAVNTMDSMIGYRNERYQYFGTAAAKLDDILNYIPARISAYLMILAAFFARYDAKEAFRVYRRDKRNHASPNSAHTEAVCAGALHIQLAGDAYYFGKLHKKPTIGNADRPIEAKDICRANHSLYITTCIAIVVGLGLKSLLFLCFI